MSALNGAFQGRADRPVNYVNAPLIAHERGIEVREERSQSARDFTNLLRVAIRSGDELIRVAGTTIGRENRQWLVSALGFDLDLELAPLLVLFRYDDVPGVIGRVGTLFGDAGVNIANMTVSRSRSGGKALMVLSVDTPPPPELVERIHARGLRRRPRSSSSELRSELYWDVLRRADGGGAAVLFGYGAAVPGSAAGGAPRPWPRGCACG